MDGGLGLTLLLGARRGLNHRLSSEVRLPKSRRFTAGSLGAPEALAQVQGGRGTGGGGDPGRRGCHRANRTGM